MNREKMSEFIADYLQNDKTTFAMMLSGEWGTGKSFYIKSELKEYKKIKDNGNELMVISLYGMSNLQELSQRICYERNHTSLNAVKVIKATAKTIINYSPLPQIFWKGVEMTANKIEEKIDESIDLTGILLVLEDVERTKIDLEDFFGFVNNLCEQDNVKVLLVADENKIREKFKEKKKSYDDIKDKVVGDTIHFEPDLEATLRNIFDIYEFNDVCDLDADMSDIRTILHDRPNFRKVIYACQKVHEIFNHENFKEYNYDKYKYFRKCIFLSALSYIHGRENDIILGIDRNEPSKYYTGEKNLSKEIGTEDFPLPKFVYEYISNQHLDATLIKKCIDDYTFFIKTAKKDVYRFPEINIIFLYRRHEKASLKSALKEVSNKCKEISLIILAELLKPLSVIICEITDNTKFKDLNDAAKELENKIIERFEQEDTSTNQKIFSIASPIEDLSGYSLEHYKNIYEEITKSKLNEGEENKYKNCDGNLEIFFKDQSFNDNDAIAFALDVSIDKLLEFIIKSKPNVAWNVIAFLTTYTERLISCNKEWIKMVEELEKSIDKIEEPSTLYNVKSIIPIIKEKTERYTKYN